MSIDDYLVGVVTAELAVGGEAADARARMLEVQAILSRTYALASRGRHAREGFDLCSTTHCQLYRVPADPDDAAARAAEEAIRRTSNQVLTYQGRPIQALFHSDCGGHTSDADAVWGGPPEPYLRGVDDAFCRRVGNGEWDWSVTTTELERALDADARTRTVGRVESVRIVEVDAGGRAARVRIEPDGPTVLGDTLRSAVMRRFGPRSLRSTRFSVSRAGNRLVFEGAGNGHGAGLCQTGALARARAGHEVTAILRHYFPGARVDGIPVERTGWAPPPTPAPFPSPR